MNKIYPCLWFDNNAEEAVNLYTSIFKNSSIESVSRYGKEGPGPEGSVMTMEFTLENQHFMALNGGPYYSFTPAISLFVNVETQEELDGIWDKLSASPPDEQCGWLKDKYGLSWQIVPTILGELMQRKDPVKVGQVMQVMLKMKKLDVAKLKEAYDQDNA
jgi:predicted 3-demethylubiquinone-9 3-methyltransferase (glyoxalase superfamily)